MICYPVCHASHRSSLQEWLTFGSHPTGTTQVDGLKLFIDHDDTKGIVVIGEIGGEAELNAAEFIKEYRSKTSNPKPIVAMVSGRTAPEGKTMGHAGALLSPRDASADKKAQELEVTTTSEVGNHALC